MNLPFRHGPSTEAIAQGDPTGATGAGDGDSDGARHYFRVRIERADGSRIWHVEEATDAEAAASLAGGRGMGRVVSVQASEK